MAPGACFPGDFANASKPGFVQLRSGRRGAKIMNRRDLESLLLTLESTPVLLVRAAEGLSDSQIRQEPPGGGFSFVEHVWHLADLESEGYAVRIRRILTEDEPSLADFEGDRIARERNYRARDLSEGLAAFAV